MSSSTVAENAAQRLSTSWWPDQQHPSGIGPRDANDFGSRSGRRPVAAAVRENGHQKIRERIEPFETVTRLMAQTRVMFRGSSQDLVAVAAGTEGTAVSLTFRLSVGSHLAAIAVGAVAATAYPTVYSARPQSLADYILAICAKAFGSPPAAEAAYLAENVNAMTKMMIDMGIRPSGDVDADFVAMMVPHHQGAIEMAQAELRYGRNEPLRRMAQEIIVTQLQEITAMRLSLGQALPLSIPSPHQIPSAAMNDSKSYNATLVKEP